MHLSWLSNSKIQSILLITTSKISFVVVMALSKYLHTYSPLQLNFIRSFIVLSTVTPYIWITRGKGAFKTKQPLNQFIRMVLSSTSMICFFYGYRLLPLAKASAINFSYALMVPLLAAFFLKEKVSFQRWAFLLLGYVGIFMIIDPAFEKFEQGELLALIGVLLLAFSSLFVKKLTRTDESLVVVFYSSVATSFLLGAYFLCIHCFEFKGLDTSWVPMAQDDWWIFLGIGALSFMGQFTYVQAYGKSRLNFLAGFDYLKFLFASLLGFLFFKESIEPATFYGACIILICSYAIAREELKIKNVYENY